MDRTPGMPISHAKGKSLATSLLFPGRQAPFPLSLDCLHLGRTQTKKTLPAGDEGSLSYPQSCRIQFIPPQEVKQEWFLAWFLAIALELPQAWIPGRLKEALRLQTRHQAIDLSPRVHEAWGYPVRLYRAGVKSGGFWVSGTWFWALMLPLTNWATKDRLQSLNRHVCRTKTVRALAPQSCHRPEKEVSVVLSAWPDLQNQLLPLLLNSEKLSIREQITWSYCTWGTT